MAYSFQIQGVRSRLFACPRTSFVNNTYINYTIQGATSQALTNDADLLRSSIWITKINPTITKTQTGSGNSSDYSEPFTLYNPSCSRFWTDTEQQTKISQTTDKFATISGVLDFITPDSALVFIAKKIDSTNYNILVADDLEDYSKNKRMIILDTNDKYRFKITNEIIGSTAIIDSTFMIVSK